MCVPPHQTGMRRALAARGWVGCCAHIVMGGAVAAALLEDQLDALAAPTDPVPPPPCMGGTQSSDAP